MAEKTLTLGLLIATCLFGQHAQAANACLSLDLPVKSIVLGGGQAVTINVRVAKDLPAPPVVRVNVGKLAPLQARGAGHYFAVYTPPLWRKPGVAVFSAISTDGGCPPAFISVPLLLQKKIAAGVSPNARVTVRIGKQAFGPARADAGGRVEIPAVIAPGFSKAFLEIAAPGGNKIRRKIDLGFPARTGIATLMHPAAVRADGKTSASVFLFAYSPQGRAIKKPVFRIASKSGRAGKVSSVGRGVFVFGYRPAASMAGGRASIDVRMLKPYQARRTVFLRLLPGTVLKIAARLSLDTLVADGESKAVIDVSVTDVQGKPVEKLPLKIAADAGSVGPVADLGSGRYRAEWIAPLGRSKPQAVIKVAAGGKALKLHVPLVEPEPLSVKTEPAELIADGKSVSRLLIRAFARDGAGGPAEISLWSSLGTLPSRVRLAGTRAEAVLRAGKKAGTANIVVRYGKFSQSVAVPLRAGAPALLRLTAPAMEMLADGMQTLPVSIEVEDAFGNPVPNAHPLLTCSVGKIFVSGEQEAPGRTAAIFRPPAQAGGAAVIRAAVSSGLTNELRIALRDPPKNLGLALSAGIEHNLARLGSLLVGVDFSLRLTGALQIVFGAGYFQSRIKAACPNGPPGCASDLSIDAVPLTVAVMYRIENQTAWTPVVSAGAAAVWTRVELSPSFQAAVVEATVAPGAFARAGVELAAGPGGVLFDLGYLYAPWLGSNLISGNLGGLSARLGYRFAF
ncbi:MAG TPA: hypothetical protein VM425_05720 [Myxococcota bacterium]|nr:hypothetical protein [Myxococcota bacterium]